jgi:hypothetical protein
MLYFKLLLKKQVYYGVLFHKIFDYSVKDSNILKMIKQMINLKTFYLNEEITLSTETLSIYVDKFWSEVFELNKEKHNKNK